MGWSLSKFVDLDEMNKFAKDSFCSTFLFSDKSFIFRLKRRFGQIVRYALIGNKLSEHVMFQFQQNHVDPISV